jgi:hypothetical protein
MNIYGIMAYYNNNSLLFFMLQDKSHTVGRGNIHVFILGVCRKELETEVGKVGCQMLSTFIQYFGNGMETDKSHGVFDHFLSFKC